MDNRINEIRRKINLLRSEMPDLERAIRDQVNRDLDCTDTSLRLIGLRRELARLIGEWQAAGGRELTLPVQQRIGPRATKRDGALARMTQRR